MKKFLFCFIALLGLSMFSDSLSMANTQVCKISQSNDTVEVFSCYLDNNKVKVTLSNDSENIKANVTVTVEVTYGRNTTRTYSDKTMAQPGKSTILEIPIETNVNTLTPTSVKVISISGSKCL